MGADEGALLQHGEGDWHTGARIGPHKNTWWTDASPHGLTEGGKKISGKCKGGKGRHILLTAHLHAHSSSRLKLQIRKPCKGGRRGIPCKPVSGAEEGARAQVDESTETSRLSQGVRQEEIGVHRGICHSNSPLALLGNYRGAVIQCITAKEEREDYP